MSISNNISMPPGGLSSHSTSSASEEPPRSSFMARVRRITNSVSLPKTLAVAGVVLVVAGVGVAFATGGVVAPLLVLGGIVVAAIGAVIHGTKPDNTDNTDNTEDPPPYSPDGSPPPYSPDGSPPLYSPDGSPPPYSPDRSPPPYIPQVPTPSDPPPSYDEIMNTRL